MIISTQWSISPDGKQIFSEGFDEDVTFTVDGEFKSDVERVKYALAVVKKLTTANKKDKHGIATV